MSDSYERDPDPDRYRPKGANAAVLQRMDQAVDLVLARHGGVAGLSRISHDMLLAGYLRTDEHEELAKSFAERRSPDTSRFGH